MAQAITKDDILEAVANMSVMDVCDLVSAMEKKFGVSAAAVAVAAPAAGGGAGEAAAAEEKTEFNVVMTEVGSNKINVIKVIREITGLGLKEAKDMTEAAPPVVVKEAVSKDDAQKIKKKLEEAGAKVDVK